MAPQRLRRSREVRWLFQALVVSKRLQIAALLCIAVTSAATVVDPIVLRWVVDVALPSRRWQLILLACAALVLGALLRLLFHSASVLLVVRLGERFAFQVRRRLFRHLHALAPSAISQYATGDLATRITNDVEQISRLVSDILPTALRTLFLVLFAFCAMTFLNWRMALVIAPLVPAFLLLQKKFRARVRTSAQDMQESAGDTLSFLQHALPGISQVQSLCAARTQASAFAACAISVFRSRMNYRIAECQFAVASMLIVLTAVTIVLAYGGFEVIAGALSTGSLIAFFSFVMRLFEPLTDAAGLYSLVQRVRISASRVLDFLDIPLSIRDTPRAPALALHQTPAIALCNVSFFYNPGSAALQDVSLCIAPREKVALLGRSGSGKSTLIKLLNRIEDPAEGSVHIGGDDVRRLSLASVRAAFAVVPQDPIFLGRTIKEELLLGRPNATPPELERALHIAQLGDWIRARPAGWNTSLIGNDTQLSGGEKQRIAIARAVVQNRPILILDEATSALDPVFEERLLRSLLDHMPHSTILLITHRKSALKWMERHIVLSGGMLCEDSELECLMCS
jgi:ATP-binding cassette subfamily B protein